MCAESRKLARNFSPVISPVTLQIDDTLHSSMSLDEVERDILSSGIKDVIGLWETEKAVERFHPSTTLEEGRQIAMKYIRRLLDDVFMVPGDLTGGGFRPWTLIREEVLARSSPTGKASEVSSRLSIRLGSSSLMPVDALLTSPAAIATRRVVPR